MNNPRIAVFDVETPNGKNDSICSIGIVLIEDYKIVGELYYLVNPEDVFDYRNIQIHKITEKDVANAPTFPEIWENIKMYFSEYLLVGHNLGFDLSCIKKSLTRYGIEANPYYYADTLNIARDVIGKISNYKLTTLCDYFGLESGAHHNALDDSYATANLLLVFCELLGIDIDNYIKKYSFQINNNQNTDRTGYFSNQTKQLQELQGILFGVTCDGILSDDEILAIQNWTINHEYLRGNFPFDKIYDSIEQVLEDNVITEDEREYLYNLFNKIINPVDSQEQCCEINLEGSVICLTGDFECMSKNELAAKLERRGAIVKKDVIKKLNYLIVGNKGNERWSHGNYGNKVKKAMEYNEKGCNIEIIKEIDFISYVLDN